MNLTAKSYPVLALLLSAGLLIGAWIFQYGFGYPPCQMCYWQRHAHKVIIAIAVLALIMTRTTTQNPKLWTTIIVLAFLTSFAVAFWHVGVEYKWWEGPKTCLAGDVDLDFSTDDLLGTLGDKIKLPGCSEAVWHFLGLSMAAWNAIASLFGAVLGLLALKNNLGKKHA